jgi:hypothetical protein
MSGGGDLVTDGTVPAFGLRYDIRQRPLLGDYVECFEEAERLVWSSEHHFVDDGYLSSRGSATR